MLTVLPGKGPVVGWRFVTHPAVRKVCFTGSTEVGKRIMAGCAEQVKRVTLELGGKSANIVFADADLERAAARAPAGVFDNAGQDCCARSRILVERSVYDRFLELLEPAVAGVRVGDPTDEASEMGPLISAAQHQRVASFVPEGAPVAFRGTAPSGPGFWFPPTVLVPPSTRRPLGDRGDLRAGGGGAALRGRGGRRRAWPTTPSTGSRAPSGPATWGGPCGWPGRWTPGTSRSIRIRRSATGPRSAASSSLGSGASSVRTRSTPSPT